MHLQLFLLALLLTSTLVHEAGHWLAGKLFGYRIHGWGWIPPRVHLLGPRGHGAAAPPLEAITVALGGPALSAFSTWAVWRTDNHACAFLWALAGVVDIVAVDGYHIITALSKAWRQYAAVTSTVSQG